MAPSIAASGGAAESVEIRRLTVLYDATCAFCPPVP
jgi:hypothetical protein